MKKLGALLGALTVVVAVIVSSCAEPSASGKNPSGLVVLEDGTHQFTDEQGNVTRFSEFQKYDAANSDPDAGVASFVFPSTRASNDARVHAEYNSNYFEIWGRKTTIESNAFSKEILVISDTYAATDVDTDYPIVVEPGRWEFILLAGVRNRTANAGYYYEYPPVSTPMAEWDDYYGRNRSRGSYARPLLLASAYNTQQIPNGGVTVVNMVLKSTEFSFAPAMSGLPLEIPCTLPATGPSPFTAFIDAEVQTGYMYPYLTTDGAQLKVYPDNPADFTTLSKISFRGSTSSDSAWPRKISQDWGFYAPPPSASEPDKKLPGKIVVDHWYVYAFGNPLETNTPISSLMYLGGGDAKGRPLYRNEWTIADAANPETRTVRYWPWRFNREDETFGAVFKWNVLFIPEIPVGGTVIHGEWEN